MCDPITATAVIGGTMLAGGASSAYGQHKALKARKQAMGQARDDINAENARVRSRVMAQAPALAGQGEVAEMDRVQGQADQNTAESAAAVQALFGGDGEQSRRVASALGDRTNPLASAAQAETNLNRQFQTGQAVPLMVANRRIRDRMAQLQDDLVSADEKGRGWRIFGGMLGGGSAAALPLVALSGGGGGAPSGSEIYGPGDSFAGSYDANPTYSSQW